MINHSALLIHSDGLSWYGIRTAREQIPVPIIGEATSADEAIDMAVAHTPDLVVASATLSGESSWPVLAELRRVHIPSCKMVVFTNSDISIDDLMTLGQLQLSAFLTWRETSSEDDVYCALKLMLTGNYIIGSRSITTSYLSTLRGEPIDDGASIALTEIERRLLKHRAAGCTNTEIALVEPISKRSVERTFCTLRGKFDAPDNAILLMKAAILGLVP